MTDGLAGVIIRRHEAATERAVRVCGGGTSLYSGWRLLFVVVAGGLAAAVYIYSFTRDLPSVEALQNYQPPITTRVYAGNGTRAGRICPRAAHLRADLLRAQAGDQRLHVAPKTRTSTAIPASIRAASCAPRSRTCSTSCSTSGPKARPPSPSRWRATSCSTATSNSRRKIQEAILAIRIDATYSKDKILELYLNEIFLGENSYGVAAAALNYFGKSLDELDVVGSGVPGGAAQRPQQLRSAHQHRRPRSTAATG